MITRRTVLSGLAGAAGTLAAGMLPAPRAWSGPAVPNSRRLGFQVVRKNEEIGRHDLVFAATGDRLTVSIQIELSVTFGPLTLYRYRHEAVEHWAGGEFISLEARTDDNGKSFAVAMQRDVAGLSVTGAGGSYLAPPDAHPSTHWNRGQLAGPMINTQTGEIMRPEIVVRGPDTIARADGAQIRATRYSLSGDAVFDLWYSERDVWTGLTFVGRDGTEIRYIAT